MELFSEEFKKQLNMFNKDSLLDFENRMKIKYGEDKPKRVIKLKERTIGSTMENKDWYSTQPDYQYPYY